MLAHVVTKLFEGNVEDQMVFLSEKEALAQYDAYKTELLNEAQNNGGVDDSYEVIETSERKFSVNSGVDWKSAVYRPLEVVNHQLGGFMKTRNPKEFIQMPNGMVWLGSANDFYIEGVIKVYSVDCDSDFLFEQDLRYEITGMDFALADIAYTIIDDNHIAFSGHYFSGGDIEDISEVRILDTDKDLQTILEAFKEQYNMNVIHLMHAISAFSFDYGEEQVISRDGCRELRIPSAKEVCSYVRLCVGGMEIKKIDSALREESMVDILGQKILLQTNPENE